MIIKLVYESEEVHTIRKMIKNMDSKQLYLLEHILKKERAYRGQVIFNEFKQFLDSFNTLNKKNE